MSKTCRLVQSNHSKISVQLLFFISKFGAIIVSIPLSQKNDVLVIRNNVFFSKSENSSHSKVRASFKRSPVNLIFW